MSIPFEVIGYVIAIAGVLAIVFRVRYTSWAKARARNTYNLTVRGTTLAGAGAVVIGLIIAVTSLFPSGSDVVRSKPSVVAPHRNARSIASTTLGCTNIRKEQVMMVVENGTAADVRAAEQSQTAVDCYFAGEDIEITAYKSLADAKQDADFYRTASHQEGWMVVGPTWIAEYNGLDQSPSASRKVLTLVQEKLGGDLVHIQKH